MAQSSVLSQLHQELAILIADSTHVNHQLTINPPKGADSLTRQTVPWCLARGSLLQLFDATSSGSLPGQLDSAYSQNIQGCLGPSCTTGGQEQQLGSIYSHSCSLTAQCCYSLFHLINLPSGPSTHKVDPLQLPIESKGKDPLLSIYLCNLHLSDFMPEKVGQHSSILPLASLSSCTQCLKYHCPSSVLYETGFSFLFILRRILPQ